MTFAITPGTAHIVDRGFDGSLYSYANSGGVVHEAMIPGATTNAFMNLPFVPLPQWDYHPGLSYCGWGKVSSFHDWSLYANKYHHCHWEYPMDFSHYGTWPQHYQHMYHHHHHQHHLEMKHWMAKKFMFMFDPFYSTNQSWNWYNDYGAYTAKSIWHMKGGLMFDPSYSWNHGWNHDYSYGYGHDYSSYLHHQHQFNHHYDTGLYPHGYYHGDAWGAGMHHTGGMDIHLAGQLKGSLVKYGALKSNMLFDSGLGYHGSFGADTLGYAKYGALKSNMLLGSGLGCHGSFGLDTLGHIKSGSCFTGGFGGYGFGGLC